MINLYIPYIFITHLILVHYSMFVNLRSQWKEQSRPSWQAFWNVTNVKTKINLANFFLGHYCGKG